MKEVKYANPKNIIWIQTAFIGDVILTTAAARALKKLRPDVKQVFITTPVGKMALKNTKLFDEVISYNKKGKSIELKSVITQIAEMNFPSVETIILQPHKSIRSSILASKLGFQKITYEETIGHRNAVALLPRVSFLHEAERIKLLLEPLGISREASKPFKPYLDYIKSERITSLLESDSEYIAIAPGSVWATKKWQIEGYLDLARKILAETSFKIVIVGSKAEQDDASYILKGLFDDERRKVVNLVGMTSLEDLRAVYPKIKALISNDSSPIHYASAFNVPTVSVFGATKPAMGFGPLAEKSRVVEISGLECRPCSDHGPKVCPLRHFSCMKKIASDEVFTAVLSVLQG